MVFLKNDVLSLHSWMYNLDKNDMQHSFGKHNQITQKQIIYLHSSFVLHYHVSLSFSCIQGSSRVSGDKATIHDSIKEIMLISYTILP